MMRLRMHWNWITWHARQARFALRWLLLPAFVAYWLYSQVRCTFGWHRWDWWHRPRWHDGYPAPVGYRHQQICTWCGVVNLDTEYWTRGDEGESE